jgi:hypothetical protein
MMRLSIFHRSPFSLGGLGAIGQLLFLLLMPLVAQQAFAQSNAQPNRNPIDQRSKSTVQEPSKQNQKANTEPDESGLPMFSSAEATSWDFGMKVTAGGPAQGIVGTVPVPFDLPEQTIEAEEEHRPTEVTRIKFSNPTKDSRLMTFYINHLAAGQSVEVFTRFKIAKRRIIAPQDTSKLRISPKPPIPVRTFLKPSPFIESKHKRILAIAAELKDDSLSAWDQVEKVYVWVRESLVYKFDPTICSCLEALDAGHGDCEEMSSLFIAICRAMKIPARAVLIPDHTYPEFYLEDENGKGYWFPCQLAGQYEFGSMTELKPVLHKGDRFRVPGQSQLVRYLQPTLIEKGGQGQITIEWITRNNDFADSKK